MIIVAGPPGSGKSTLFPVQGFGFDFFNADDVAASRNGGSYVGISLETRTEVNRELEQWILNHIASHRSFAIETTLRSDISLVQATQAATAGFRIAMILVVLDSFERNVERVANRARAGGHSASLETLRDIYRGTLRNLPKALGFCGSVLDVLDIYDNSAFGDAPRHIATIEKTATGIATVVHNDIPQILRDVMAPYLDQT